MVKTSEQLNELATALAKAQGELDNAIKGAANAHFRSKYADLASVVEAYRDTLSRHGLSITQHPTAVGVEVSVTTILLHTSGQYISSTLTMTAKDAGPQAIGSCITYARRYGSLAVVGIAPADDDGEAAEARPTAKYGYVNPVSKPLTK